MNGEYLRGEVYYLLYENPAFPTTRAHRPVVIVSSNKGNEVNPFVLVLGLSTKVRFGLVYPKVESTGRTSWIKANEIQSVQKDNLASYVCTLTESEMESVDKAMVIALGLSNLVMGEENDEIEKLNDRIAELEDALDDTEIERDVWKRMYGKAIDKIIDHPNGIFSQTKAPVAPRVEFEVEEQPEPVEINTCTGEELRKIGCTPTMIHWIIEKRPYKRVEDLKAVPSITQIGYKLIESRVCCVPVTPKININTATAKEISEFLGFSENLSFAITGHRKRNGKFASVSELANVERLPKNFLERFGDKLTV